MPYRLEAVKLVRAVAQAEAGAEAGAVEEAVMGLAIIELAIVIAEATFIESNSTEVTIIKAVAIMVVEHSEALAQFYWFYFLAFSQILQM